MADSDLNKLMEEAYGDDFHDDEDVELKNDDPYAEDFDDDEGGEEDYGEDEFDKDEEPTTNVEPKIQEPQEEFVGDSEPTYENDFDKSVDIGHTNYADDFGEDSSTHLTSSNQGESSSFVPSSTSLNGFESLDSDEPLADLISTPTNNDTSHGKKMLHHMSSELSIGKIDSFLADKEAKLNTEVMQRVRAESDARERKNSVEKKEIEKILDDPSSLGEKQEEEKKKEEKSGEETPVQRQSFMDRMGGADDRVYDVDYYLDNGEDVDDVDHEYVTKYESVEIKKEEEPQAAVPVAPKVVVEPQVSPQVSTSAAPENPVYSRGMSTKASLRLASSEPTKAKSPPSKKQTPPRPQSAKPNKAPPKLPSRPQSAHPTTKHKKQETQTQVVTRPQSAPTGPTPSISSLRLVSKITKNITRTKMQGSEISSKLREINHIFSNLQAALHFDYDKELEKVKKEALMNGKIGFKTSVPSWKKKKKRPRTAKARKRAQLEHANKLSQPVTRSARYIQGIVPSDWGGTLRGGKAALSRAPTQRGRVRPSTAPAARRKR